MLSGENFGGRHDGGLALVFNGFEGGKCRNDGFPGTDVARNETLHRMREGEPRVDFGRHALLSAGKREGEGVRKGAGERVVFSVERRCREVPFFRSALSQVNLLRQKFVKNHAAPFGRPVSRQVRRRRNGVRRVKFVKGFCKRRQREGRRVFRRNRFPEVKVKEGPGDAFSQNGLREAFRSGIDGR